MAPALDTTADINRANVNTRGVASFDTRDSSDKLLLLTEEGYIEREREVILWRRIFKSRLARLLIVLQFTVDSWQANSVSVTERIDILSVSLPRGWGVGIHGYFTGIKIARIYRLNRHHLSIG